MIETSQIYKDEIKSPIRKMYGKVQIDYTDTELDQSIETQTSEMANISKPIQTADALKTPTAKIASLDGSWVLNGSYKLYEEGDHIGWWGKQLAGPGGVFNTYPTLSVLFLPRPITKLLVVGDSLRVEYPVDFDIKLYNDLDVLIYTETVTNNNQVEWSKALDNAITQVAKMELVIKKWNHEGRQVKILEFFTSIQEIYEGEDIISINLIEERETSQGSLPIGNISSNEISIKLSNIDRRFDTGNTLSPLHGLVKPNRKIKAWVGTESQLIPLGVFWTKDWDVPEDGIIASTIGRDRLDRLSSTDYTTSTVQINKNMYQLAEMVLIDAGLNNGQYWIDEELKEYIVPYSYFEVQSHREALRKIAAACLGQVYCNREGIVRVEGHSFISNTLDAYEITIDDYFKKNNPSRQENIANSIVVETQPLVVGVVEEIYSIQEPINIVANVDKKITVQFNNVPCIDVDIVLTGDGAIVESNIYAWGAEVIVSSATNGSFTLKATGKPLKVISKDKVMAEDSLSIFENGKIEYKMPINPLIQTRAIAEVIADILLQYYKDPKRDLTIEWRGDPSLTMGDVVMVDDNVRGTEELGYYYIVKNELEFAGYLREKTEGRRAL